MVPFLVAHVQRLHRRKETRPTQRQAIGRVIRDFVISPLRLQQQGKRGIAANVDPFDRIHLNGDFQAHLRPATVR
jgi:hypothetical protein